MFLFFYIRVSHWTAPPSSPSFLPSLPVPQANVIIQDIRRIVKNDARNISKLHRRIFLDKITQTECKV
jgi:hypothetical protein